jgi:hypothetical protein
MKRNTTPCLVPVDPTRCKVIACSTVIEEMLPIMPEGMQYEVLGFGLHIDPALLKKTLQEAIHCSERSASVIILGYGLCSQAVVGLKSEKCVLVIPRVDDCIALFLGSSDAYRAQLHKEPGTYYLTKGWINAGDTPFDEYTRLEQLYGPEKAQTILNQVFKNYTRLALINTGQYSLASYREQTRELAGQFNLKYEEIRGSNEFVRAMLYGPWDERFLVAPPGKTISFFDFKSAAGVATK